MQPVPPAGETTCDAFHRGAFHLIQPRGQGHRAGIDAMVLAASVPDGFTGRLADLGAGAGAAGFAVAARCAGASVTLVENAPQMTACARASLELGGNTRLAERITVLEADVTLSGEKRVASGLADRRFDFVIMNPPFNSHAHRGTPDLLRKAAHIMHEGMFEAWLKTAAAILKPQGRLALIARPASLGDILAAMSGRFGAAEAVPVHPRGDASAIRIVMRARKGARGPLTMLPPLLLHGEANGFTRRAEAICNGAETLYEA